ncbi:MAG: hypothetical protein ACOYXA_02760 [Bacteroidota bacterium]
MAKRKKPSEDPSQDNMENVNDADNFGLPDIEYKPLDTPQEEQASAETPQESSEPVAQESAYQAAENSTAAPQEEPRPTYKPSYSYSEEPKSNATTIITVVIALVVVVAGILIYQFVYKPQKEKERQELLAKQKEDDERKRRDEEARKAREEEERKRREAEAAANATPKEGTIETLSERTNRYYVVISSAVDGDLVMDYAKKLSAQGISTKIIPPFGKYKFHRIAIADHETFALAQANADGVKADYGNEVWVIRY